VINSTANGVSNEAEQVGQRITERDLNRQPTITVRAGWPASRVIVNKDMILSPYSVESSDDPACRKAGGCSCLRGCTRTC